MKKVNIIKGDLITVNKVFKRRAGIEKNFVRLLWQ